MLSNVLFTRDVFSETRLQIRGCVPVCVTVSAAGATFSYRPGFQLRMNGMLLQLGRELKGIFYCFFLYNGPLNALSSQTAIFNKRLLK